jgi:APA family basic amino acid/polyamine antiporter
VPDRAILVVGGIAAFIAATGTLAGVASAAAFCILVYYSLANLAALRMPRAAKRYPDAVAVAGLLGCVVLAFSLAPGTILVGVELLVAGILYRAVWMAIQRSFQAS